MPEPIILKISQLSELVGAPSLTSMLIILDAEETIESEKVKRISVANLRPSLTDILQAVYPIGSIYISTVATNPATLFGFGTWEAYGAGRVLVGYDASQTEFNAIDKTGGAKTHTLTASEIPAHTHTVPWITLAGTGGSTGDRAYPGGTTNTSSIGGGVAHNNLQPYITVNIWRRMT